MFLLFINFYLSFFKKNIYAYFCKKLIKTAAYNYPYIFVILKIKLRKQKE